MWHHDSLPTSRQATRYLPLCIDRAAAASRCLLIMWTGWPSREQPAVQDKARGTLTLPHPCHSQPQPPTAAAAAASCTVREHRVGAVQDGAWAGQQEQVAAARHFNVRIAIYQAGQACWIIQTPHSPQVLRPTAPAAVLTSLQCWHARVRWSIASHTSARGGGCPGASWQGGSVAADTQAHAAILCGVQGVRQLGVSRNTAVIRQSITLQRPAHLPCQLRVSPRPCMWPLSSRHVTAAGWWCCRMPRCSICHIMMASTTTACASRTICRIKFLGLCLLPAALPFRAPRSMREMRPSWTTKRSTRYCHSQHIPSFTLFSAAFLGVRDKLESTLALACHRSLVAPCMLAEMFGCWHSQLAHKFTLHGHNVSCPALLCCLSRPCTLWRVQASCAAVYCMHVPTAAHAGCLTLSWTQDQTVPKAALCRLCMGDAVDGCQ